MTQFNSPHEPDGFHDAGCPGCVAGLVQQEVAKQVNEVMGKFLEKIEQMAIEQDRKDTKNG